MQTNGAGPAQDTRQGVRQRPSRDERPQQNRVVVMPFQNLFSTEFMLGRPLRRLEVVAAVGCQTFLRGHTPCRRSRGRSALSLLAMPTPFSLTSKRCSQALARVQKSHAALRLTCTSLQQQSFSDAQGARSDRKQPLHNKRSATPSG